MPRITREYLEEHHADLVEEFRAEAASAAGSGPVTDAAQVAPDLVTQFKRQGAEEQADDFRVEGATRERERIVGILDLPAQGFEELRREAIGDPQATASTTAAKILAAQSAREQARMDAHLEALEGDEEDLDAPSPDNGATDLDPDSVEGQSTRLLRVSRRHRSKRAAAE